LRVMSRCFDFVSSCKSRSWLALPKILGEDVLKKTLVDIGNKNKLLTLQRARELCKQIRTEIDSADEPAIKNILRATEQHLATLEAWLTRWSLSESSDDDNSSFVRSSPLSKPKENAFFQSVWGINQGEYVMNEMAAFAKSYSFLLSGRLYLSSDRMCFFGKVLDVEVKLAVPWAKVKSVRLLDVEEEQAVAKNVYAVRVLFSAAVDFDGQSLPSLDFRLFNYKNVAQVHRCVSMFTGSGLFEDLQDDDPMSPTTSSRRRTSLGSPNDMTPGKDGCESIWDAKTGELVKEKLEGESVVWELEYRAPFTKTWIGRATGDGQSMRWARICGKTYIAHPDLDHTEATENTIGPPIASVEILGRRRECYWKYFTAPETDADGWQYCGDFSVDPSAWGPVSRMRKHARRRRWNPIMIRETGRSNGLQMGSPLNFEIATKASSSPPRRCFSTTIMKDRGLGDPHDSMTPLAEIEIGAISLTLLGEMFSRDDWVHEGLMAEHFKRCGAHSMRIGAWATGGAASQVRGKMRSGEMVVPVPPHPMCAKETRISVTYHVLVTPGVVIYETVTMSHDVPYGSCFNLVLCDRFTEDSKGKVIMTRHAALEWLQSCWLQKQVEKGAKAGLKPDAKKWGQFLREQLTPH